MDTFLYKKYIYSMVTLFLIAGVFSFVRIAWGAYSYASIQETSDSSAVIKVTTLDGVKYFNCDLRAASCTGAASSTRLFSVPEDLTTKNYFLSPSLEKAFVSEEIPKGNGTEVQNAIFSIKNGKTELETVLPAHERVFRALWSQDLNRLILITRDNFIVTIDLPSKTVLSKKPFTDKDMATRYTLSPNGKFLAYYIPAYTGSENRERKFKLVSIDTGKIFERKEKLAYWDLLTEELKIFEFAPDSSSLIYLDDRDGYASLYKVNLLAPSISLSGTRLMTKPYTVSDFLFSDPNTLFFVANRDNVYTWSLYKYNLTAKSLQKIQDGISYGQRMRKIGDTLLYLHQEESGFYPTLYRIDQNLSLPLAGIERSAEKSGSEITLSYGAGRFASFIKPKDFDPSKTYPLLVWLHGGPYRQTSLGYQPFLGYAGYENVLRKLSQNGVAVMKVDYTGSYGYGRKFAEKIKGNVGVADVKDVLDALTKAKGVLRVNDVYVMGNSYGGYLSLRTIVDKPALFKGAISINGVTDWQQLLEEIPSSIFTTYFEGTTKAATEKLFSTASVANKIDKLTNQKILVVKGEKDATIPPRQSDLLQAILELNHKNSEIVNYLGENHSIEERGNLEDLCTRILTMIGTTPTKDCKL